MIAWLRSDPLFADFFDYAGRRAVWAILLIGFGALLEGIGFVLLIPVIGIVLSDQQSSAAPILQSIFGFFGVSSTSGKLTIVALGFAFLIGLRQWVTYRREIAVARLELGFVAQVRDRVFGLIAHLPWEVAAQLEHGKVAHSLGKDVDRASGASGIWLRLFGLLANFIIQLAIAVALAPIVTLCVFVAGAVMFMGLKPLRRRANLLGLRLTAGDYRLFSSISEFLRGLKPAKAHGMEDKYLVELGDAARDFADLNIAFRRDAVLGSIAIQMAATVLALSTLLIGHIWLDTPPAVLVVILLIMMRLSGPLASFQMMMQNAAHGRAAYKSILEQTSDLASQGQAPNGTHSLEKRSSAPEFDLKNVSWTPPGGQQPILHALTDTVPAGQITAIAGPSGVGKTTLCDLITGLYAPSRGDILVDGAPYAAAARRQVQQSLAYVGQNAAMLQRTLRDMLVWGIEPPDDALIWAELERVGITDQVAASPDGLDLVLQGDASRFSGGERQRFGLARALLRKPRMIVLDEATNALDPITEHQVLSAFFAARQDATVIMVSHREETVGLADHVIRLEAPAPIGLGNPPHDCG